MAESNVVGRIIVAELSGQKQLDVLRIFLFAKVQHPVWKVSRGISSTCAMICHAVTNFAFNKFSAILQSRTARPFSRDGKRRISSS
jgi:hypothetical protein